MKKMLAFALTVACAMALCVAATGCPGKATTKDTGAPAADSGKTTPK